MTPEQILEQITAGATRVFGHRGAQSDAPMNTIPAFLLAAEQGAHGTELDVHLSEDGVPVVIHDETVDATTDGSGEVTDMTVADLKKLDAGAWFREDFAGTQIPTLAEVFEAVGQRLYINVEIKGFSADDTRLEQAVIQCIRDHHMTERVIISSFNAISLVRVGSLAPNIPLGYLHWQPLSEMKSDSLRLDRYHAQHPMHTLIDADLMQAAKQRNHTVTAWTVNEPQRARELQALGVNIIVTDKPGLIRQALIDA
jgi:glycerophosphoryl diester phosphodiesterase